MAFRISEKNLLGFCVDSLVKEGMSENNAVVMARALIQADMWGIFTHGVKNLNGYILKANAGGVSFTAEPTIEKENAAITIINGNNTMGYVSSVMAMEHACQRAMKTGIAAVFVKNSSHFGATGYYSNIAAEKGLIGFAASNVDKKMSVPGGKGMIMGHNPFSLAAPAKLFPSIILDSSSSNVASLRVLKAKELGEKIPDTWITDKDGIPTNDPSRYPNEGALQPLGNYKGFGIAIFIEILTSILLRSPNSTMDEVYSWCFDLDKPNNVCHCFIAIDSSFLGNGLNLAEAVNSLVINLHNAPKAKGCDRITLPGEIQWENYFKAKKTGIELPSDVIDELQKVEKRIGTVLKGNM